MSSTALTKPKSGEIFFKVFGPDRDWVRFSQKDLSSIGTSIAKTISENRSENLTKECRVSLVDFGGVAEHILGGRDDTPYLETPPKMSLKNAYIYSFVPTNKKFSEVELMAKVAEAAGLKGIIILTKKDGDRGKAPVAAHIAEHLALIVEAEGDTIAVDYYEDSAFIFDEIEKIGVRTKLNSSSLNLFWVRPPIDSKHRDSVPTRAEFTTIEIEDFVKRSTN